MAVSGVPIGVAVNTHVPEFLITAESQPATSRHHLPEVDAEADAIQTALGGPAMAEVQRNISVSELGRLLTGRKAWFFPGHGDAQLHGDLVLAFVSTDGELEVVSIDTLVELIRPHVMQGKLELIVLTGCCTAGLAAALRERAFVPYVLCWETVLKDEAGKIFGSAFAQAIASETYTAAYKQACAAVCALRESGHLDTGHPAQVPKFVLDVDPKDSTLVHPHCPTHNPPQEAGCAACRHAGRLKSYPTQAGRGRVAAGVPKLLCYETTPLHDVPTTLPAHFQPRPEQNDLRDALVVNVRGHHTLVGIVGADHVTGIAGSAGLGKTTTATWLALDPIVRNAYCDGIFWLEFGQKRTAEQQLSRLAKLLSVPAGDLALLEQ